MYAQKFRGESHGKIILMGEHSVVHFQPAIAMPLREATMTATLEPRYDERVSIDCEYFTGFLTHAPSALKNLAVLVEKLRADFSLQSKGFHLRIESHIPHERGMGSSAAVAVAVTRAIANFAGKKLIAAQEFEYAQIAENITHLNASGMDSATVSSTSAVWFQRNEPLSTLEFDTQGVLVVADTGVTGATKEAVADVRALRSSSDENVSRETSKYINRLGELTYASASALQDSQLTQLGQCMNEAHEILQKLSVSSPELDTLVAAALSAGALGAKLTGGGRGGCMIALVNSQAEVPRICEALTDSGAVRLWKLPLISREDIND